MNQEELNSTTPVTVPQVFAMLAEPVLEHHYQSRLETGDFCLVWNEPGSNWKATLLSFPYDVVVVDFSVFSNEPIESLIAIKKLSPEADIIVLSDSRDARLAIAAFRLGIRDYFLKPVDPETLAYSIEKTLKQRELRSAITTLIDDFELFHFAEGVSASETAEDAKRFTAQFLMKTLKAEGSIWTSVSADNSLSFEQIQDKFAGPTPAAESAIELLRGLHESEKTAPPKPIFAKQNILFPLKEKSFGALAIFGTQVPETNALITRTQFIIQTLDNALENLRRYNDVKQLTYIDDLTGLYNSRFLEISVGSLIQLHKQSQSPFSILFVDIDKFKSVNDNYGHLVGSQLLVELAAFLQRSLRKPDRLFRYGGDEFICLLPDTEAQKAFDVAERVRKQVEQHGFYFQGKVYRITLSIGIAAFPEHAQTKQDVLRLADEAMYESKKSGRNKVFLTPAKNKPAA